MPEPHGPVGPLDADGLRQTNFAVLEERLPRKVFRSDPASLQDLARRIG